MLGQRAHRDIVHSGRGKLGQSLQSDVAGDLQLGAALIEATGFAHHGQVEVVQHHDIGTGGQCLLQFGQGFDLDLHRFVRIEATSLLDGAGDAATGKDMVLLDEVGVEEADAVVLAAAASDGVLLGTAQAGNGLAGVEQAAAGLFQLGHITGGEGGDAGEGLHKVEGIALAGQQQAGRTMEAEQLLIGGEALAILHQPLHLHLAAELGKDFIHPGLAAEDAGLAGDDPGAGEAIGGDQLGRDIGAGIRLVQRGEGIAQIFE